MNRVRNMIAAVLALGIVLSCLAGAYATEDALSDTQVNAIAMLNYITVLTQEINASKNSRLFMEDAYSSLINNTNPNSVDSRTLSQLTGLLDTMENYRMVSVKRDRLQYIYEQNQAEAIRAAVPDPLDVLNSVMATALEDIPEVEKAAAAGNYVGAMVAISNVAAAVVYMAVDSYTSYTAYQEQNEFQYLIDGWALDDEEAEVLHNTRKGLFSYMIKMVGEYDLPGDLTLTENSVEEFVRWKNDENNSGRIQFLESNRDTYKAYGGYWLVLAESYYDNGDYQKCLDAFKAYEDMDTGIFRKDDEYASILPLAVAAADKVMDTAAYETTATKYAQAILDNSDHSDWALRYFAAQTYIDLYGKTQNAAYLEQAYAVTLDNVNYLTGEQRDLNDAYLSPVQETKAEKNATKDEKKQIESFNKMLKEERKTALPPVYEPLRLNCDLLAALADEMDLSAEELERIDRILHVNGTSIFLTKPLNDLYAFGDMPQVTTAEAPEIEYDGTVLILPAECITQDVVITVTVQEADADEPLVIDDWKIDTVHRGSDEDITTHQAAFTSEKARNHEWKPDARITVEIVPMRDVDMEAFRYEFVTHGTKNEWYDYLKPWEGHKNNWYDYAKVWENSVEFEQVEG